MARLAIYSIGLLVSITSMILSDVNSALFVVSSGLFVGFVIPLSDAIVSNHRHARIAWYGIRTWRSRVRVSASYLYRIRVDNEYLLVKGNRFEHYQPVGGVYKYHNSSAETRIALQILDDDLLVPDDVSDTDLRIRVPGRRLFAFVRWFERGSGRETDAWREFYEEMVATGILPGDRFRHVAYDHLKRIYRPLRFSPWANSQELLIADILELLPTPDQLAALRELKDQDNPRFIWASENRIRRLGATEGEVSQMIQIAETARWTIDVPG